MLVMLLFPKFLNNESKIHVDKTVSWKNLWNYKSHTRDCNSMLKGGTLIEGTHCESSKGAHLFWMMAQFTLGWVSFINLARTAARRLIRGQLGNFSTSRLATTGLARTKGMFDRLYINCEQDGKVLCKQKPLRNSLQK